MKIIIYSRHGMNLRTSGFYALLAHSRHERKIGRMEVSERKLFDLGMAKVLCRKNAKSVTFKVWSYNERNS